MIALFSQGFDIVFQSSERAGFPVLVQVFKFIINDAHRYVNILKNMGKPDCLAG